MPPLFKNGKLFVAGLYETVQAIDAYNGTQLWKIEVPESTRMMLSHNAGFMAAGYARASGKVGAAMVTSGPGATNMVTPVRDCMADSVPIVVICGQVPRAAIGTDAFQEVDIFGMTMPIVKHSYIIREAADIGRIVDEAFEIAKAVPNLRVFDPPFEDEHSLEVQLPFLQVVLDDFRVLPVLVGQSSPESVSSLIDAL